MALAVRQGSPEWLETRRGLITATAIPVLLGLSPYQSEADLAAEKGGAERPEPNRRMRIGTALEPLIASEYERETGRRLQRVRRLLRHPDIEWAATSTDYRVIGERRLVECKWTGSRSRFADGLPQDVEAQVAWELGCSGYPAADVAVLVGDDLRVFPVEADAALFEQLVTIAADFRRRMEAGGPFAESAASVKARYLTDSGAEMVADPDIAAAVRALVTLRERRKALEADEERIEVAIKSRMADATRLVGDGFTVTWKRTKDVEQVDWKSVADGLLRQLPETERTALVGLATTVRPGFRPFRVVVEKED